jgi:hypothetical protein
MVCDIHILLVDAGNVELGGNLLCALKCDLHEHIDRCNPHPSAIGGLLELHTTRKAVVSYARAHMGGRELTSIAASSKEVLERAAALPAV